MELGKINSYFSYSNLTSTPVKSLLKASEEATSKGQDSVEISSDAAALLNMQNELAEETYTLNDVLQLHYKENKTQEELDMYHSMRKNNPKLDIALYEMDKAEALECMGKVQNILLKSLMKQALTPEERKMVKDDVFLQQEIARRQSSSL